MAAHRIVVGKYRLNEVLGTGGMAEVWSATNKFTERQIAIKFMHPEVGKNPEAAARFLNEAKVTARIAHPNIIDIQDVGQTEEGQLFLVMELLHGVPLENALKRQMPPMTLAELARIMIEVGDALSAAHKSGIVHRDLKPTNIFLHTVKDGVRIPKILDFGVSKFFEDEQNPALTVTGSVLGSPLYMSPEQARGETSLDGRTDVFAFGAILFEALCGFRAYEARNFNALIIKIGTTPPRDIDACAPAVPESLRRIVRACLEWDLKKRAPSFEAVTAMLRAALPELQRSSMRLPTTLAPAALSDTESTQPLPPVRPSVATPSSPHRAAGPGEFFGSTPLRASAAHGIPSDAPAAYGGPATPSDAPAAYGGPATVPPPLGATLPSWQTPHTSYASIGPKAPAGSVPPLRIAAIAAGLVTTIGVATGVMLGSRSAASTTTTTAVTVDLPAVPVAMPTPPIAIPPSEPIVAASSPDVPAISVDALPRAGKKVAPRGVGRLAVSAAPGWCALHVDGKDRGPTPVVVPDLVAGPHRLECRAPTGKLQSAVVQVEPSGTARHKFSVE